MSDPNPTKNCTTVEADSIKRSPEDGISIDGFAYVVVGYSYQTGNTKSYTVVSMDYAGRVLALGNGGYEVKGD
jgi:hypothetical protein